MKTKAGRVTALSPSERAVLRAHLRTLLHVVDLACEPFAGANDTDVADPLRPLCGYLRDARLALQLADDEMDPAGLKARRAPLEP